MGGDRHLGQSVVCSILSHMLEKKRNKGTVLEDLRLVAAMISFKIPELLDVIRLMV